MDQPAWLPVAIVAGFLVVFPLYWSGVVFLIGLTSGWHKLGKTYRTEHKIAGHTVRTLRMGWSRYNRVVRIEGSERGLGIDIFVLFRPGHAPLCVPWPAVSFKGRYKVLFWSGVELEIGASPVSVKMLDADWATIESAARRGGVQGLSEQRTLVS